VSALRGVPELDLTHCVGVNDFSAVPHLAAATHSEGRSFAPVCGKLPRLRWMRGRSPWRWQRVQVSVAVRVLWWTRRLPLSWQSGLGNL